MHYFCSALLSIVARARRLSAGTLPVSNRVPNPLPTPLGLWQISIPKDRTLGPTLKQSCGLPGTTPTWSIPSHQHVPACAGSCPDPPPESSATRPRTFFRSDRSATRCPCRSCMAGLQATSPASASSAQPGTEFTSFLETWEQQ